MTEPVRDSVELAQFREAWRIEVRQRNNPNQATPAVPTPRINNLHTIHDGHPEQAAYIPTDELVPVERPAGRRLATHDMVLTHTHEPAADLPPRLQTALDTYANALRLEEDGQIERALRLYRQAFRIDSQVDRIYYNQERRAAAANQLLEAHSVSNENTADYANIDFNRSPVVPKTIPVSKAPEKTSVLKKIVESFEAPLSFEREDERAPFPLGKIPEEIVLLILMKLDVSSVERFAMVSKKARVLTLDPAIWRESVKRTYVPPQVQYEGVIDSIVEKYALDFRQIYIQYPRIRLDGVYIAVCHYVRRGLSENAWVSVSHLITYHRYLRFLPDGTVLSLLANEGAEPQTIVHSLNTSLQMKGFTIGRWSLKGSTIDVTNLVDPSGGMARYAFQMRLTLRSRPLGRWNKLDLETYDTVHRETGEASSLPLKHERPFWFSKVRSYSV